MNTVYNKDSFGDRSDSLTSAEVIVPLLLKLEIESVVDVGCGNGEFLSVFQKHQVNDYIGLEGPWISEDTLRIEKEKFKKIDFEKPFSLGRKYDLAISLEVAEHLKNLASETFIKSLTSLAPMILFSAAVPHQGGLHHINEQWLEYWGDLFDRNKFIPVDFLRDKIWHNDEVSFWYSQNTLLFVESKFYEENTAMFKNEQNLSNKPLSKIHPKLYLRYVKALKKSKNKTLKNRLKKLFK